VFASGFQFDSLRLLLVSPSEHVLCFQRPRSLEVSVM
jgi:hypothetical protein